MSTAQVDRHWDKTSQTLRYRPDGVIDHLSTEHIPMAQLLPAFMHSLVDTARFVPLLLPMLNLALVYSQQSTSGPWNAFVSMLHVFSNPVDSLWSILYRQNTVRRHYLFAAHYTPDIAREFAAVLATYDQWLEDASPYVSKVLAERQRLSGDNRDHTRVLHEEEKMLVRRSTLRLRSCRHESLFNARVSIMYYLLSLAIVVWKVWLWNDATMWNEAGHIFSLIAIQSHLTFAIYINATTGTFTYHEEAARIIFELCTELGAVAHNVPQRPVLLPLPTLIMDGTASPDDIIKPAPFSQRQKELGSVSGTLSCIRALKSCQSTAGDYHSSSPGLFIALSAVLISFGGALGIAVTTSVTRRQVAITSILGCLLIWLFSWAVSLTLSTLLRRKTISIAMYGHLLLVCDVLLAVLICFCFGWSVVAWQKADKLEEELSHLIPFVWVAIMLCELGVTHILSFWASSGGVASEHIYVRSFEEALADIDSLC